MCFSPGCLRFVETIHSPYNHTTWLVMLIHAHVLTYWLLIFSADKVVHLSPSVFVTVDCGAPVVDYLTW